MRIPTEPEDSAAFMTRVAGLIGEKHSPIRRYLVSHVADKGRDHFSRGTNPLAESGMPGRVHVPIGSVHEYLRHHVATTI